MGSLFLRSIPPLGSPARKMLFSLRLSPLSCPLSQEKPRKSGASFLNAGREFPVSAGSVTPSLEETEAVFPRPVGEDPVKAVVLSRMRKRPLKISGILKELCPLVGDVVDE